jgi:hypothetical protein
MPLKRIYVLRSAYVQFFKDSSLMCSGSVFKITISSHNTIRNCQKALLDSLSRGFYLDCVTKLLKLHFASTFKVFRLMFYTIIGINIYFFPSTINR